MMKKIEHFNETHNLEIPDQLPNLIVWYFCPKKVMEKLKRDKPGLYFYYSFSMTKAVIEQALEIRMTQGVEC